MLPRKMLPRSYPDGIHIAFDDHRPNWSSSASTWAMPRVGRTRATR